MCVYVSVHVSVRACLYVCVCVHLSRSGCWSSSTNGTMDTTAAGLGGLSAAAALSGACKFSSSSSCSPCPSGSSLHTVLPVLDEVTDSGGLEVISAISILVSAGSLEE